MQVPVRQGSSALETAQDVNLEIPEEIREYIAERSFIELSEGGHPAGAPQAGAPHGGAPGTGGAGHEAPEEDPDAHLTWFGMACPRAREPPSD